MSGTKTAALSSPTRVPLILLPQRLNWCIDNILLDIVLLTSTWIELIAILIVVKQMDAKEEHLVWVIDTLYLDSEIKNENEDSA